MEYLTPVVAFVIGTFFGTFVAFSGIKVAPLVIYGRQQREREEKKRMKKIKPRWNPGSLFPPPSSDIDSGIGGPGPKYPPIDYESPGDYLDPIDPKKEGKEG